jgi:hypothetical protein
MADIVRCSPTEPKPTCHMSLSDGVTTIPLVAVGPDGQPEWKSIRREPYPRNTLKVDQGGGELSQMKAPYGEFTRNTWIGGIGQEDGEKDSTAYWFGKGVWPLVDGKLMLQPRLFQAKMPWQVDCPFVPEDTGGKYVILSPTVGERSAMAVQFTPTANGTIYGVAIKAVNNTNTGFIYSDICNNNAGVPGTQLMMTETGYCMIDNDIMLKFTSPLSVTSGTVYWMCLYYAGDMDMSDINVEVLNLTGYTVKRMNSGGAPTWSADTKPFVFTLITEKIKADIPFEYRNSKYKVTNEGGTPHVYLNGDRGACDSNAGALSTLVDATKTWGTTQFVGAIAVIIEGPGKGEWRTIVSHNNTTLTLDRAWDTTHTTASSYVIKYTPVWRELTSHGLTGPVTDVTISNENVIYMAMGQSINIRKFQAVNASGVWKELNHADCQDDDGTNKADLFCQVYNQTSKVMSIIRGNNAAKPGISKADTIAWNPATALSFGTELYIGGSEEIRSITPLKGSVLVIKGNGRIWEVKDWVPDVLSIEMSRFDDNTGKNACVFTPWLVFPYENGIERLLGQEVNDFRPNTPAAYNGQFVDFLPIPGAILGARACGTCSVGDVGTTKGGVFIYRNNVWYLLAGLGTGNKPLSLDMQRCENGKDILWITTINGVYFMRLPQGWDPRMDIKFTSDSTAHMNWYEKTGWVITGAFNLGNRRLDKQWEKIFVDWHGPDGGGYSLTPYRVESNYYSDFIPIPPDSWPITIYDDIPLTLGEGNIRDLSKEIIFLFQIWLNGALISPDFTPVMNGFNVEYLSRIDDADMWVVPVTSEDYQMNLDKKKSEMSMQTYQAKLDEWSRSVVPLTLASLSPLDHGKRVIIGRNPMQPKMLDLSAVVTQSQRRYEYSTSVTIYEVPD